MVFTDKPRIKEGTTRVRKSFCIKPYRFDDKVYWLQRVNINERFLYGLCSDFWHVTSVKTK